MALNEKSKIFVVYITTLKILRMTIYFSRIALIINRNLMQIVILQTNKVFIEVPSKYANYANIFLLNLAIKLPKNTDINRHSIEIKKDKKPPYRSIYSLEPVN